MTNLQRTSNKKKVIRLLFRANDLLLEALSIVKDLNKDGHQFDYCTDSELSEFISKAKTSVDVVHSIIYQEGSKKATP